MGAIYLLLHQLKAGRWLSCSCLFTVITIAYASPHRAQPASEKQYQVVVETGVRAKMRDGVSLVADIYRPIDDEKFPVLLRRTPYGRKSGEVGAYKMASNGYVVIVQDVRGRFDSEGTFYPFRDEGTDGYDTVEWAASLKYCNGQVGWFAGSYGGASQMLAAMSRPPHLVAILPDFTASEYYDGWTYQNGAFMQLFAASWSSLLAVDTIRRQAAKISKNKEWFRELPIEKYPILLAPPVTELAPYYRDWVLHEQNDQYWKRWKVSDH